MFMPEILKDVKIPVEILKEFKGSARIIERLKWRGIWPIDERFRHRIEEQLPQLRNANLSKNYEYALVYKGKNFEADFKNLGLANVNPVIIKKWLVGIPVPWRYLQKMNIDHQGFEVILTPKM